MAIAFFLQAISLAGVVTLGRTGDVWFVVTMALVFLTWGELYVLFPAVLADMFGARHAASNYSFLYSTKGLASILAEDWRLRCSRRPAPGFRVLRQRGPGGLLGGRIAGAAEDAPAHAASEFIHELTAARPKPGFSIHRPV